MVRVRRYPARGIGWRRWQGWPWWGNSWWGGPCGWGGRCGGWSAMADANDPGMPAMNQMRGMPDGWYMMPRWYMMPGMYDMDDYDD